jgi:hypothetical protein
VEGGTFTLYCLTKQLTQQLSTLQYSSVSKALIDHGDLFRYQKQHLERFCTVSILYLDLGDKSNASQEIYAVERLAEVINSHTESLTLPPPPQDYVSPPHKAVTLYHKGQPLVTRIVPTLRSSLYSPALCSTICKQEQWTDTQFSQVDWPALEEALLHTWSCKRITFSKLSHKLLNTNRQSKRFYSKSDQCPCCQSAEETILHMLTCPAAAVVQFRSQQQKILWTNLSLIDTSQPLLDCLKAGILSQGSLPQNSLDDHLVVEAYEHQTSLGWEAFFHGRISHKWQIAYDRGMFTPKQSLKWAGQLVNFLLHYSQQLWNFRCSVVHGQTTEEAKKMLQATLLLQVQSAYEEYRLDPFHIFSDWRRLFVRPLQSFSLSDCDTLSCWMRSYTEAVQQQAIIQVELRKQSKEFFTPFHVARLSKDSLSKSDEESDSEESSTLDYIPFDPGPS